MLTARVNDLEAEVQRLRQSLTSSSSTSLYNDELMSLVSSSSTLSDSPITIVCLESFSLSTIIADVRRVAPSYSLLCNLGDVRRHAEDAHTVTPNELKALVSLCVRKVKAIKRIATISQHHAHCPCC